MAKSKQICDGCGSQIRHGWPRFHKLFCTPECAQRNFHKKERKAWSR